MRAFLSEMWYLLIAVWAELLIVAAVIVGLAIYSRADSTVNHHAHNTFGALTYQDNPNSYLMGRVSGVDVIETKDRRRILILEVRSTNTYQMFSQQLQLCVDGIQEDLGDQLMNAVSKSSIVVFTYSKRRHELDCNDLYRIDTVEKKAIQ